MSESFQKMMEQILFGIEKVEISIDDVTIHAESMQELVKRLRCVFVRLRQRNLKLNRSKCQFGLKEIKVLGHVVSAEGIKPDPSKTEAIRQTPPPKNLAELRSFLGTCGYVSKFIQSYANIVEPLRRLTRKENKWEWGVEQVNSFRLLKQALTSEPVLVGFSINAPTFLVTDASPVGLGAILLQKQSDGERKPVAYISKTLSEVERRYSQIEREALAIVWAVQRFHNYLFGIPFTLLTDNKPLTSMFNLESKKILPPRIQRLAWKLQEYKYDIKHIAGRDNIADSISRLPSDDCEISNISRSCDDYVRFIINNDVVNLEAISLSDIRRETKKDLVLSKLCNCLKNGNWLACDKDKIFSMRHEMSVHDDILLRGNRIVVPSSLQSSILKLAHETHMGIVKTKQLLRTKFYWVGMDKDVEQLVKNCDICVINQPFNANVPLQPVSLPEGPWKKGAVDIVGPIEDKYIITYIDYYSSYPEAVVVKDISTKSIVRVLSSIFSRFGYPEEMVSDNGKQFVSSEFQNFIKLCGIKHVRCSPYYPRSNGKIERFHRYLKKNLRSVVAEGRVWEDALSGILLAYRSTPHSGSGETPAKLMLGREIRTKLPEIELGNDGSPENFRKKYERYQARMKKYHDRKEHVLEHRFKVGDKVFMANRAQGKLESKFLDRPYIIKERLGKDSFKIENISNGKEYVRNQKHLKLIPQQRIKNKSDEYNTYIELDIDDVVNSDSAKAKVSSSNNVVSKKKICKNISVNEQSEQKDKVVTTRSGRIIKTTKRNQFVYY